MFGSALDCEDARKQLANAIAMKAMGKGSQSEIEAVARKKWKCGECGKKSIIGQSHRAEDGGFSLVCAHCGRDSSGVVAVAAQLANSQTDLDRTSF